MNYAPITSVYRTQLAPGDNVAAFDLNQENDVPIEIRGFRFTAIEGSAVGNPAPNNSATCEPGVWLDWGLQIGSREVRMGDLVPVVATCPRKGYADGVSRTGPSSVQPDGTYYEFKLKDPAFVLPGTRVYVLLRYSRTAPAAILGSGPTTIDATVEMYGKAIPGDLPPPLMVKMPWMTSWRAPVVLLSAAAAVEQSSPDSALANQYDSPVRVTSMLGCLATKFWAGEIVPNSKVRISSSLDGYFVREPTPIMELFSGKSREWGISCAMQSKEYWTVEVAYDASPLLQATTDYAATDQIQAIFGLVGYRTVPLETLYRDPKPEVAHPNIERARPLLPSEKRSL